MKTITPRRIKNKLIRTFFNEQWSIFVCDAAGNILKHIAPEKDRFWADPFPVDCNGRTYIFVEQQIGSGNGTLGYIELYSDLNHSGFTPILEKPYHLSYPCIFQFNDEWYLVPESHESHTVDLYRAGEFPRKWNFLTTLIEGIDANDSTLFYHDDFWWLFTSIGTKHSPANNNLNIFYSGSLEQGRWIPHPGNPVVSGFENSRMAGHFFVHGGKIFRPAQNCKSSYGRETNINEILELNTAAYREKLTKTITPEKAYRAVCTHTFNFSKQYLLRDIKTRKAKFLSW